mmetsp:Transcript_45794/g.129701  ORF Transcript_45794/g.129701 Transcript_45794/m.129701 type:complete len:120 (+) Transcript_45794:120-479(+)
MECANTESNGMCSKEVGAQDLGCLQIRTIGPRDSGFPGEGIGDLKHGAGVSMGGIVKSRSASPAMGASGGRGAGAAEGLASAVEVEVAPPRESVADGAPFGAAAEGPDVAPLPRASAFV